VSVTKHKSDPGFPSGWCVEFRSMARHRTCEAGIDYTALNGGSEYRRMHHLPCFIRAGEKPGLRVHCEHFRAPNAEEIERHGRWIADRQKLVMSVKLAISAWREEHQGRSMTEIVDCPACGGRLHLSIRAHSDNVQGRCETSGWVSWTE
jgi:hypothetical protein